ncbi:MAG: RluA family pseudouridine synthase [Candidatus Harrisonbacteria bacterium]|nr:RluA family pseudouridine synthase [Candidatus Harrisonbacteria bacterium]
MGYIKLMVIHIITETKDFLAINKPAGLLVHGVFDKHGPKHSELTLVDWLLKHYPDIKDVGDAPVHSSQVPWRPGIVHRLDRETSGVLIIARNQASFEYLKTLFQTKNIEKKYTALVWGKSEKRGVVDRPISIKDGSVKRTVFLGKMPRPARTEYERIGLYKEGKNFLSLLDVWPKTGRTHQIRVHLSSIGHSVVGDKLYGKKSDLPGLERHFLHASEINFTDREGNRQQIKAALPEDLQKVLDSLEKEPTED